MDQRSRSVVEEPNIDIEPDESTVYLIHEIENREDLDAWLAQHYQVLFEEELSGWYTDESLWPLAGALSRVDPRRVPHDRGRRRRWTFG